MTKIRRWLVVLPLLVVITAVVGVLTVSAHGGFVFIEEDPPGTWMPWWVTIPFDAYFDRDGAPWVQVHQHFLWDDIRLNNFKALNADFQWELNRLGNEYWDYWHCFGPNIYWTNLPDATDFWSEEQDPPWCFLDKSGNEEFEVKSRDPNALQAFFEYSVYVELSRDGEDLGKPLPYQTEAEYCGKQAPFCNWGQTFGWGLLIDDVFANP